MYRPDPANQTPSDATDCVLCSGTRSWRSVRYYERLCDECEAGVEDARDADFDAKEDR